MNEPDFNPYEAPESPAQPLTDLPEYRPNGTRAAVVIATLGGHVLLQLVGMGSDLLKIVAISGAIKQGGLTEAVELQITQRDQLLALATLILLALSATAFLVWTYRAYSNLPALGAKFLRFSPGASVGAFFFPFINLVRPYQAFQELWKASDPDLEPNGPLARMNLDNSRLVGWWWGLWLISGVVAYYPLSAGPAVRTLEDVLNLTGNELGIRVIEIASAALAMRLVQRIQALQEARAARRAGEP
jgi:hypothetical protein